MDHQQHSYGRNSTPPLSLFLSSRSGHLQQHQRSSTGQDSPPSPFASRYSPPRTPQSPPRTPQGLRPGTRESISSSRVFRDLSPQKVFDITPESESRTSLPSLFKLRNGLQSLRPSSQYSDEQSWEQQQQEDQRRPRLLQSLEAFLNERLALVDRAGSTSRGYASTRMRTDAHQQVFDAFLHSFITYRSLLARIKNEYDKALDDALKSVYDNVHMQAELTAAQEQMDATIRSAQQAAREDAADARREIQDELEQHEALAAEAEQRVLQAEEETSAIRAGIAKLKQEEATLSKANQQAQAQLMQQSSFQRTRK